jgi:hypothetical protein
MEKYDRDLIWKRFWSDDHGSGSSRGIGIFLIPTVSSNAVMHIQLPVDWFLAGFFPWSKGSM